jgi:hypothetical protein
LAEEAQRKKLGKKETRKKSYFALASATNASRVGWAVAFEKATQNFPTGFATKSPINSNLSLNSEAKCQIY